MSTQRNELGEDDELAVSSFPVLVCLKHVLALRPLTFRERSLTVGYSMRLHMRAVTAFALSDNGIAELKGTFARRRNVVLA